jgi:hypothetical protein
MNRGFSLLYRAGALRGRYLAVRPQNLVFIRAVASSVSGRPASQTLQHATLNVKEEVGNSAADLAKTIAGGYLTSDIVAPTGKYETFVSLDSRQSGRLSRWC